MNNSEIHLFILWENALGKKEEIINEIKNKFTILKIYKMHWSDNKFIDNLSRFYGTNLPDCEAKANHCGNGEFYLIIVKDENPIYAERNTSKGIKYLNINMFECKEQFRNLTGGGHKVHATNDEIETNHDITLLLNVSLQDFKKNNPGEWDGKIEKIEKDLFGCNGWKNATEMFYALNNCVRYAVLRNYENLPKEIYVNEHNDIDLICDSVDNCAYILNAEKVYLQSYRVNYRVKVEDKIANFDLRNIGDNYYCYDLECNLLKNRVYNENGFFVLSEEEYFYTLLYHALIHKNVFKEDYKIKLSSMKPEIMNENTDTETMIAILKTWLQNNKYLVTVPNDKSVDYNIKNAVKFRPLFEIEPNMYFEEFNANILKWYEFKESSKLLFIGDNKNIEEYLENIKINYYKISRFSTKQEITDKYDYILIYGVENYSKKILNLKLYLKENGKVLVIGNNEFGIRNWCKYNSNENIGINELNKNNFEKITIKKVIKELKAYGIEQVNKFYAFPNYKETELILNEKFDISKSHIEKYNADIQNNDVKINDEIEVLKNIVENSKEDLDIFANSFIIEASNNKIDNDVRYVSFNNCRNKEYRLVTIIKDNIVKKIPANSFAKMHVDNVKENVKQLNEQNFNILDYVENGLLYSKRIENKLTLDKEIAQYYYDFDRIKGIFEKFKKILMKNSIRFEDCKEKIKFKNATNIEKLHFLKKAYWDMIPKNCFEIDGEYFFFDQEWEEDYLPVEFIIYRSIINCYELVKRINVNSLLEKLGILEYKLYFEEIDNELRKKIINENLYKQMYCKEVSTIESIVDNAIIFKIENKNKEKYINCLEKNIENLKSDNLEKQEYINCLEKNIRKKKRLYKR